MWLLLSPGLQLLAQDAEDKDVAVASGLATGLAQHALLLKAVALQRIDAGNVVVIDLGLDALQGQDVEAPGAHQLAGLHAAALTDGLAVGDDGLEKRVALPPVDIEESHQPQGLAVRLGG